MTSKIVQEDTKTIVRRIKEIVSNLEGKTILISGGAGFLGSYIIHTIIYLNDHHFKRKCKVISVDNYITGTRKKLLGEKFDRNYTFIEHDVSKPLRLRRKIDYIIHAAGIASPVYYQKFPLEAIEANATGAKNLLDLGRRHRVKSFLYFSSSEIYGDPDPKFVPTPESYRGNVSSIGPRACYDESKRLGEALSVNYFRVHKVPIKIVRPFNIYGPGMKREDYRVIPTFLSMAIAGKSLPVHDTGKQTRTYCYVSDAIVAFFKVLLSGQNGEVYNVGNDQPEISTLRLAKLIIGLFNYQIVIKRIPYPDTYPTDVPKRRCPDLGKIRKEIGYKPQVDLVEGLQRLLTWYKETEKA